MIDVGGEAQGTVRVDYRFNAEADRVFDAWVVPSLARLWLFATPTGEIVRCDIDARAGGQMTVVDRRDGEDVEHTGAYEEVERPSRLVFRFAVPKYSSQTSRVIIEIEPAAGGGARLSLTNEDVPPEWQASTADGWRTLLARLSEMLDERR